MRSTDLAKLTSALAALNVNLLTLIDTLDDIRTELEAMNAESSAATAPAPSPRDRERARE